MIYLGLRAWIIYFAYKNVRDGSNTQSNFHRSLNSSKGRYVCLRLNWGSVNTTWKDLWGCLFIIYSHYNADPIHKLELVAMIISGCFEPDCLYLVLKSSKSWKTESYRFSSSRWNANGFEGFTGSKILYWSFSFK